MLEPPLTQGTIIKPGRDETGLVRGNHAQDTGVIARPRKTGFVRRVDGTKGLVCNQFYRLILSNGCPFNCQYCYLRLTFGANKGPVVFTNPWIEVERRLEKVSTGVFSTGELADSLAVTPPLLSPAIEYFRRQKDKFLFLTTKSSNIDLLLVMVPTTQVWISFSMNAVKAWELFEKNTPHPYERLAAARRLKEAGWRVRIRIAPIIEEIGMNHYRKVAEKVSALVPERVTVGVLKQFPRLLGHRREGFLRQLSESPNGISRYPSHIKIRVFNTMAEWLGFQPAICRETTALWEEIGWKSNGCNCTPDQLTARRGSEVQPVNPWSSKLILRRTSTHG